MIILGKQQTGKNLDNTMREVVISQIIKDKLPGLTLGCIECQVAIEEDNPELWGEIESTCKAIHLSLKLEDVGSHPAIRASRMAYRVCGKDPARYRLSSEALMRRVVKGNILNRVNNVVDLLNLVSLRTGMSIGGYDTEKISGSVIFDIGKKDEPYEAIGRGGLNIEFLPIFRDLVSPFGSPTSDAVRTSVSSCTKVFLMIIAGFSGEPFTSEAVELSVKLLKKYAGASNIETILVSSNSSFV
jgi:DNA/RNA-binding domain of Phe-tRNA-synthetase-like protein